MFYCINKKTQELHAFETEAEVENKCKKEPDFESCPPRTSFFHSWQNARWVLDEAAELADLKAKKRDEIENGHDVVKNSGIAVQINVLATGAVNLTASTFNNYIIDLVKKVGNSKALEPAAYVFIPFTPENMFMASTVFANDTEVKPVSITCFGAVKSGNPNTPPKIQCKAKYTRIDSANRVTLTLLSKAVQDAKIANAAYRLELLMQLDNATTKAQVLAIVVKTKRLNDNSIMNQGFSPVLMIDNGKVVHNTTGLELEF